MPPTWCGKLIRSVAAATAAASTTAALTSSATR